MTSDRDLRARLTAERQSALARVTALEHDFAGLVAAAEGANADDEHDPEGATLAFERQHLAALLEQARQQVAAVTAALGRLADRTYGRCERCGEPIPAARLAARPTATTCVGCTARQAR
jgi:DnaK suppressor protein